jgi:hypothetical protein
MPRDLFEERNIKVDQPRDLFKDGIPNNNKESSFWDKLTSALGNVDQSQDLTGRLLPSNYDQNIRDLGTGFSQSLVNYPKEIANLFLKEKLPLSDWGNHNAASNFGGFLGDLASFSFPGKAASLLIKGGRYLPIASNAISSLKDINASSPTLNYLSKLGSNIGQSAIFGAAHDNESPQSGAIAGGILGGASQGLTDLVGIKNPLISLLAKSGLGALIGQFSGGHPIYGAGAAVALPEAIKYAGLSRKSQIPAQLLEGLTPAAWKKSVEANRKLGTLITPGEATGNRVKNAREGNLMRTPESDQYALDLQEKQANLDKTAINNMLDKIYVSTPKREKEIDDAYRLAYRRSIPPRVVEEIKNQPIMEDAFTYVKQDPAFRNVPENNYKFLAEVNRHLKRKVDELENSGRVTSARLHDNIRKEYNDFLHDSNEDYAKATDLAQPKIVRNNIVKKLNRHPDDYTAKNFYSKFLSRPNAANELLEDASYFPEAHADIKLMQDAWKNRSNLESASSASYTARKGLADIRNDTKQWLQLIKKEVGSNMDKNALDFIYSPDWHITGPKQIEENKIYQQNIKNALALLLRAGTVEALR